LELFWWCGIFGFWNCSDGVVFFCFLWYEFKTNHSDERKVTLHRNHHTFIYRSDLHTIINMYEYNTKNGNDIMCLEKLTLVVTAIKNVIY
jgi:hypothetical protein